MSALLNNSENVKVKKTIIALTGRANCGKTKTLIRVLDLLEKEPGAKVIQTGTIGQFDKFAIILIGRTKIGITTPGDPPPNLVLPHYLKIFIEVECDIIICACRTKGSTRDAIRKYEETFSIQWIWQKLDDKSEAEQSRIQETMATKILGLVMELMTSEPSPASESKRQPRSSPLLGPAISEQRDPAP
jgi:hypothetical protein